MQNVICFYGQNLNSFPMAILTAVH